MKVADALYLVGGLISLVTCLYSTGRFFLDNKPKPWWPTLWGGVIPVAAACSAVLTAFLFSKTSGQYVLGLFEGLVGLFLFGLLVVGAISFSKQNASTSESADLFLGLIGTGAGAIVLTIDALDRLEVITRPTLF